MEGKLSQSSSGSTGVEQFSCAYAYLMTFGVSMGAVCFGYNLAVISGVMLYALPFFDLDSTWHSVIAGAALLSATVSSFISGTAADKLGRRRTLLLTAVLCVVGPVLGAAAPNKEVLLAGRLVTGLTFPLLIAFGPLYIAEMSSASVRGKLLTVHQLQRNTGLILSAIACGVFSYLPDNHWRYMLGFAVVPAVLFGIALFVLPETPRWLIARGRLPEATRVLQRIYGCEEVTQKVKNIEDSVFADAPAGLCSTLPRVVKTPHVLKALAVGVCLAFFFSWSGLHAVLTFSGMIMKTVSFPVEHAVWIQGLVPLAMFIGQLPGIAAVEKYGRRPIVLVSIGASALSLMLVSVGFHLTAANLPDVHFFNVTNTSLSLQQSPCHTYTGCEKCVQDTDCGLCYQDKSAFCLPAMNQYYSTLGPCSRDEDLTGDAFTFALDYCPSAYAWIVVAGFFLFSFFFSPGIAGLAFPIIAEIYPMWARSTCTSVAVAVFWISSSIVIFNFLAIVEAFEMYGTFWFFAAMCTLGFVLLAISLPETKNRSLEEVEELFMTSKQLQRHRQQRESSGTDIPAKERDKSSSPANQEVTRI